MKNKKVNTVYKTTDHKMFTRLDGNKDLNKAHLKRLKDSIKEESLCVPIIVNENYEIIDGQHRHNCYQELKLPVPYLVVSGYGLEQVHRLNNNTKDWKIADYAHSYCELGSQDYCKYQEFKNKYNLGDYESIAMLVGNIRGSGKSFANFRNGKFKIKNWSNACKDAEEIHRDKPYYESWKKRSFVIALLHLFDHKDFKSSQLINKFKKFPSLVYDCVNSEQYVVMLEKLYNRNQTNKVSLQYN